ncbi:MAG: anti-sigma factor family protein [Myxococcota bacterium]
MSRCGRTQQLEAVVSGEAPAALCAELRAHATHCPLCQHELNWLESERTLFRQRAGREEVARLWDGLTARQRASQGRRWGRVLAAMAAAALLALFAGRGTPWAPPAIDDGPLESDALMSPVLALTNEAPCSKLPSGVGFQCTQVLASR